MDSTVLLASIVTAAAVAFLFVGVRTAATADQSQIWRRLRESTPKSPVSVAAPDVTLGQRPLNILSSLDAPLRRYSWAQRASKELLRGEIHLRVAEFILIRIGLTSLAAVLPLLFFSGGLLGLMLAVCGGVFAWIACGQYVKHRVNKRRKSLEDQLDQALTSIATSMKSGFAFLQACKLTTEQLKWPLKQEIEGVLEDVSLGATIEQAMTSMGERVESYEMDIAITAVLVQRAVGGDLAEILDNTARTIRDRKELRGHIMSLTAQQRLSAIFVALIPPGLAGLLSITSPQFMHPLWETTTGHILVVLSGILDLAGFLIIKRITRIDF